DETANATSLTISSGGGNNVTAAVGDTIIVVFAMADPAGSGPFGAVSATDSAGNTYTVDADVANPVFPVAADGTRAVVLSARVTPSVGPSGTTVQPDELVIAAFGYEDSGSFNTAGAGYTQFNPARARSDGNDGVSGMAIGAEYKVVSATGAQSATATIANSAD